MAPLLSAMICGVSQAAFAMALLHAQERRAGEGSLAGIRFSLSSNDSSNLDRN